jgi:hypothetical protein
VGCSGTTLIDFYLLLNCIVPVKRFSQANSEGLVYENQIDVNGSPWVTVAPYPDAGWRTTDG